MVDNNMNENDDIVSRILEKRRRDCEMLDESVNQQIVSLYWDDQQHTITDDRDQQKNKEANKLVWLVRYYMERAQNNTINPSIRRSSWNALKKLLSKIDENVVVAVEQQKKKKQNLPPPPPTAGAGQQQQQPQQQQSVATTAAAATTNQQSQKASSSSSTSTQLTQQQQRYQQKNKDALFSMAANAAIAGSTVAGFTAQQQQQQQRRRQASPLPPPATAVATATGLNVSVSPTSRRKSTTTTASSRQQQQQQQQQRQQQQQPRVLSTFSSMAAVRTGNNTAVGSSSHRTASPQPPTHHHRTSPVPTSQNNDHRTNSPLYQHQQQQHHHHHQQQQQQQQQLARNKNYIPPQQQQQQVVRAPPPAAAASTSRQDNRNAPGHHQPPPYQKRPPNALMGGGINNRNQPSTQQQQQQVRDMKKWLAPFCTGDKKIYMIKGRHEYTGAIKEKIDRPIIRFYQTLPSIQATASALERLERWDPFWEFVGPVKMGFTCKPNAPLVEDALTALSIQTNVSKELVFPGDDVFNLIPKTDWGFVHTTSKKEDGKCSLILRMLPLESTQLEFDKNNKMIVSKKRADCHLWPKGTCLQIDRRAVKLEQRKQQAHDLKEWKSICKHLDVTPCIRDPKCETAFDVTCHDDALYIFALSICRYRSLDTLFEALTKRGSKDRIRHMSRQECITKIKRLKFGSGNMISLDSDDDEDHKQQTMGKFVFSLKCPISKQLMKIPVRGGNCEHCWQCFDLRSFLETNEPTSGQRWRCQSCNNFISIKDLEVCGLTAEFLDEFSRQASPERDRIEYSADDTYRLLDAHLIKSRNRKRDAPNDTTAQGSNKRTAQKLQVANNVIDLL